MKKFIVDTGDKKYKVEANDAEHATKLVKIVCKDARRINYDDDIIKVTLNGKEVFKGYAEDWIDDDFYSAFKWTGSQYEASNAKGKWVVKVIDSLKDEASPLQTVNALLEDERAAVDAYNVALENLKGKIPDESYAAIEAIRNDENRHIENLQAVVNGNVTEKNLEDSVKDEIERRDFDDVRVVDRNGHAEIGWPSKGTVSVSEAERFLRNLQKAIDYAKRQ